ncbi:RE1 [Symbiodinium sp. CCMP2592]|nr:RE1 [Symbiodinium sp. CCMP2592]
MAAVPLDDDDDLDAPELQPAAAAASSAGLELPGNPFSPARSPQQPDPGALLSNMVLNKQSKGDRTQYASFSEANKADLGSWKDWSHSFSTWLIFADGDYERLLRVVEENIDHVVVLEREGDDIRDKSQNGLEIWRQLLQTYEQVFALERRESVCFDIGDPTVITIAYDDLSLSPELTVVVSLGQRTVSRLKALVRHIREAELRREHQVDHTLRSETSRTVVSLDFGYCCRDATGEPNAKDRLTVLFMHDRHTKAVHAIPTAQKGGSSLNHLVTEAARFVIWLGHRSLRISADNEPSIVSVQNCLLKALRNLGIDASKDNSPIESHQSNGAVEQVVGGVRVHAACLMHDHEKACGASEDQVLFSPQHPLYGIFVTRSVRRVEDNFDADLAASFDVCTWEHGLSSIGGQPVLGCKKPAPPVAMAMPVPSYVGPKPSADDSAVPLVPEAPGSPSQIAGTESPACTATSMDYSPSIASGAAEVANPPGDQGDALSTDSAASALAEAGTEMPAAPVTHVWWCSGDDQVMAVEGQISLVTASGHSFDSSPPEEVLFTSGDECPCVAHIRHLRYEHEDESEYDQGLFEGQVGDSELLPELCRPRTADLEPELSPEELEALDVIADGVEIARLERMSVLLPEAAAHSKEYEGQEPTKLTTRMVRTWCEKQIGDTPLWYRRSRYVAREYAWLSERHDLFSPASTAVSNRLLPIHFLCHEPDPDDPWVMVALDISDAYLSGQRQADPPTRLVIVQHAGVSYVLGRVLPGQRDGSKEWYLAFSTFLDEALGFKKCDALPSLIREPASKFSTQMHVDDLLGAGSKRFLNERLRPTLESKYRVSVHILEKPGDTISFLKRHHTLVSEGRMLLTPSAKNFEKLFSVMKIDERSAPKKTPYASLLDEVDNSEPLPPADAKAFRCAIGILLYLAVDLIECQRAIRALSSYMTSPTRDAQIALRQLLKYLLEGQHHGLLLDRKHCCGGVSKEIPSTSQGMLCLESFSDANWVHHFLDASAAKAITERSGVGRVRHLSVRVLWSQQLVAEQVIALHKAMRDAIRTVRASSTCTVSKPMVQAIVDDDLPDWANRVLVWFLGLWVRDDTGVSVVDMLMQPSVILLTCILMLMLGVCIRTLCCRSSSQSQLQLQISSPHQQSAVSVQFDRRLNVHVGVAAPGTPANPMALDTDDEAVSPPHVASAMRKGARSKASSRRVPRCRDSCACWKSFSRHAGEGIDQQIEFGSPMLDELGVDRRRFEKWPTETPSKDRKIEVITNYPALLPRLDLLGNRGGPTPAEGEGLAYGDDRRQHMVLEDVAHDEAYFLPEELEEIHRNYESGHFGGHMIAPTEENFKPEDQGRWSQIEDEIRWRDLRDRERALPGKPQVGTIFRRKADTKNGRNMRHFPGMQKVTLEKMVRRAHEGLGHPERERFLRILHHSRASEEVLQVTKDLRCPLDEELRHASRGEYGKRRDIIDQALYPKEKRYPCRKTGFTGRATGGIGDMEVDPDVTPEVPEAGGGEGERPSLMEGELKRELDEGDQPPGKRSRMHLLEIYNAQLQALAKQRQKKESHAKDFRGKDAARLQRAIAKEVSNNLATGAYKLLSIKESDELRRCKADKIMESRYVITKRPLEPSDVAKARSEDLLLDDQESGFCKAKCRHVMKGSSEAAAVEVECRTPQVGIDSVIFIAQVLASMQWVPGFLDFTRAFHSGDKIDRQLYCSQPLEGVPGAHPRQLINLLKTCYGLTDGPLAWYKHLARRLQTDFGYTPSKADPCVFLLHGKQGTEENILQGIVGVATDDVLHGGSPAHWANIEQIAREYLLGKNQTGTGRFCGKDISLQADGSIKIDQEFYVCDKVTKIPVSRSRRQQRYSKCTVAEVEQLRSQMGVLSWLSKETRCDLAGRVSLLQQSFPEPRVLDLLEGNKIAEEALKHASLGIKVMPIPWKSLRISAATDAAWGNAKDMPWLENHPDDYWEETSSETTVWRADECIQHEVVEDTWCDSKGIRVLHEVPWTGCTGIKKATAQDGVPASKIHSSLNQLQQLSSQGGQIIIYHDVALASSGKPVLTTVAAWKSFRLKRKVVDTLATEGQSLQAGIGAIHWHRLLFLEAFYGMLTPHEWREHSCKIPFFAAVDFQEFV